MDTEGYWHDIPVDYNRMSDFINGARERFVIAFDIGSTVELTRGADKMLCVFEKAEKNKVTLRPIDESGKTRPYLDLAERVLLGNGADKSVPAQIWDNRNGLIVLRTLSVSNVEK